MVKKKKNLTPMQTHIRAFKRDKDRLMRFMRKKGIKSQSLAIKKIFDKVRLR